MAMCVIVLSKEGFSEFTCVGSECMERSGISQAEYCVVSLSCRSSSRQWSTGSRVRSCNYGSVITGNYGS